jgi:hypothetical protein
MSCPQAPLRFAPLPGRRRALGRRRPSPLHRPASLSPLFCIVWEGKKKMVVLPIPPALFALFHTESPLFPSIPSLKIRPYILNYTTKTTLSLYNYTPGLFSKTPTRFKYYN